jgi:pyridinium-3,5-bisthiocarboxylic acid mononucleotide nickel chelatase
MRIVYLEPFSGISGDMMLGALLDLGLDFDQLEGQLRLLEFGRFHISRQKCSRAGIQATRFVVTVPESESLSHGAAHEHRSFRQIREIISGSGLSGWVKEKSVEAFCRLAEAEGKIHDKPKDDVHFHEVGAVDSIVDIVGTMICMEHLAPARVLSSPVNLGQGTVECRHGTYPVPAPATQELLKGVPTYSNSAVGELTTPTGAALLSTLVERYGPRPLMKIQSTGYGAGARDLKASANVLRVTIGEEMAEPELAVRLLSGEEEVLVIEAAIDDMNPQIFGYFQERALKQGALDVYVTPVQMKKNRPGFQLTVVCAPSSLDSLARLIFAETTTIGIRFSVAQRRTLRREYRQVQTEYGAVTIKISSLDGQRMNFVPEYEDCRRLAEERGVALKEVQAAATRAYLELAR